MIAEGSRRMIVRSIRHSVLILLGLVCFFAAQPAWAQANCPPGCPAEQCKMIVDARNGLSQQQTLMHQQASSKFISQEGWATNFPRFTSMYCIDLKNTGFDLMAAIADILNLVYSIIMGILQSILNAICNAIFSMINNLLSKLCIPLPDLFGGLDFPGFGSGYCNGIQLITLQSGNYPNAGSIYNSYGLPSYPPFRSERYRPFN